jgi:WD40 repeat protein
VAGPALRLGGVVFGPDGSTFAVPADPSGVTIYDTQTGEVVRKLTGHDAVRWDLAFSPDGAFLAGAAATGIPGPGNANRSGRRPDLPDG